MGWTAIYHLGDLRLTLPVGATVAAWLLAGGARRLALRWLVAFGLALAAVGASKIGYLGWGIALPALHFKALSGHAAGFTAACTMLCLLAARGREPPARRLLAAACLAATAGVATALVLARQHTLLEAAGGWAVGMAAALSTRGALSAERVRPDGAARAGLALPFALAFLLCAAFVGRLPVGYWMVRTAVVLSGNPRPHAWRPHHAFPIPSDRRPTCAIPPCFTSRGNARASSTPGPSTRC